MKRYKIFGRLAACRRRKRLEDSDHRSRRHRSEPGSDLRGDGRANDEGGGLSPDSPPADEPADHFVYDPADPVPTCGGASLGRPGPVDQRSVESRGDVLCYTSDALSEDLVVVGPVRVELFAASDAPRTDFTAKLVEVTRDGAATGLCDGIARRGGRPEPRADADDRWLAPGVAERFEIDLWAVSCRIRAGSRLRLEISSSNFPRFDRNPNTRAAPGSVAAGAAEIARVPAWEICGREPNPRTSLVGATGVTVASVAGDGAPVGDCDRHAWPVTTTPGTTRSRSLALGPGIPW